MLYEWQQELKNSLISVQDLFERNLITEKESQSLGSIGDRFQIRLTPYYAQLIENSPSCPIRKQAIPNLSENDPILPQWATELSQEVYGRPTPWTSDPIGDYKNLSSPRLTHRYPHRALLHLSSLCAVYCRFCFRKVQLNDDSLSIQEHDLYSGSLEPAFQYLEQNPAIHELILTGGDPLSVTEPVFKRVLERIQKISTLKILRIHSRMAVTLPSRFNTPLLDLLNENWNFQIILVSHFNHVKELTSDAIQALTRLKKAGVTLLNQSVLLKGVNDSPESLIALFQRLYESGILPYYLHHPDWTPGTFHFRTSIERGKQIYSYLRGKLSGPALPDYILDTPGGNGKISLMEETHQLLRKFNPTKSASLSLQGALYEFTLPETRSSNKKKQLYLDLYSQ